MRLSPQWIREFVDLKVDDRQLADDLTLAGVAVESIRQMDGQTIFEMEIGTNRPDAMCHFGVARECSAVYDVPLQPIVPRLPRPRPAPKPFPIEIEDAAGCGRYTGRVIRTVNLAPSPAKILDRLRIDEHGGVNNVVDASNYTLMELGHPTHAFDLDKLAGGKIIVRRARPGESVKTLDGVERKLDSQDLIIADAVKPVALAGIMGGLDSAISNSTRNILIESAWFDPVPIRKTARRLGMHTDASHIFERGADWGATVLACNRVAELVLATAGGELEGEVVDAVTRRPVRHSVWLRRRDVLRHLGQEIPDPEIVRILGRLGFKPAPSSADALKALGRIVVVSGSGAGAALIEDKNSWIVDLPTWRLDVEREIDLIEEIARIYGYNRFANTLPAFSSGVVEQPDAAKETKVRSILLGLGYHEAISSSFISPADGGFFSRAVPVLLANPLSEEQAIMRTSMVPGMFNMVAWNLNRGTSDVRLFEMGNIFSTDATESPHECKTICLGATGNAQEAGVHGTARIFSFFDLKGDVESVLQAFEIQDIQFDATAADYYHPGRSAQAIVNGHAVAQFGQIHPDVAAAHKIKQDIYFAEIDFEWLIQLPLRLPRYQQPSRFPAVDRDFSFFFSDSVTFAQIYSSVEQLKIAELRSFAPIEIFRGGAVPPGKYSVLLRARFQSAERTLRDDEVARWSGKIMQTLEAIGGHLRSG